MRFGGEKLSSPHVAGVYTIDPNLAQTSQPAATSKAPGRSKSSSQDLGDQFRQRKQVISTFHPDHSDERRSLEW